MVRSRVGEAPDPFRVAADAVPHLGGEVEALAVPLELLDDPQALPGVVESPGVLPGEHRLPGVPEGGVPEVVPQRDGLHEILVEAQRPGDRAGDLPTAPHAL